MQSTETLTAIRDWLRGNGLPCPRCGGACSGYSTWIILDGAVCCENCWYPHDQAKLGGRLQEIDDLEEAQEQLRQALRGSGFPLSHA